MCNRKIVSGTRTAKGVLFAIASAILIFSTAGTTYASEKIHGSVQIEDDGLVVVGMPEESEKNVSDTRNKGDPDDVDVGSSENKVSEKPKSDDSGSNFFSKLFGEKKEAKENTIHGSVEIEDEGLVIIQNDDEGENTESTATRTANASGTKTSTRPATKTTREEAGEYDSIDEENDAEEEREEESVEEVVGDADETEEITDDAEEVIEKDTVEEREDEIKESENIENRNVDYSSMVYEDDNSEPEAIVIHKGHVSDEDESSESVIIRVSDEPKPAESIVKAGAGTVDENDIIYDNYGEVYEDENGNVVYENHRHDTGDDESIIYTDDEESEDVITEESDSEDETDYGDSEDEETEGEGAQSGDGYYIPDPPVVINDTPDLEPEAAQDIREAGGGDENLYEPEEPEEDEKPPEIDYPEYADGEGEDVLLAKLIYHEAGNQPYSGRVAVAEVVMNRVYSGRFPGNIYDVIYQPHQFSYNQYIAGSPVTEENLGIARRVIEGSERVFYNPEVLYFRNSVTTSNIPQSEPVDWGSHSWYGYVGGHAFYTQN